MNMRDNMCPFSFLYDYIDTCTRNLHALHVRTLMAFITTSNSKVHHTSILG